MGNICCQTQSLENPLQSDLLKLQEYVPHEFPSNDLVLNKFLKDHKIQIPLDNSKLEFKPTKHSAFQRYYYGAWKDGLPQGPAVIYEPDKIIFNGNFHNGYPEGPAQIQIIPQSCQYEGQLKKGKANGTGVINNFKLRYTFSGEWENSKPQKGTLTFVSDQNISNVVIQDFSKGQAIINYLDQRRYQGQINNSKLCPHGKGKVVFPPNSSKLFYDGQWYNGVMHGKGVFQWNDSSKYEGEFINGKKQGEGIFTFANGNYYEGYWVQGKQNGAGKLFDRNKNELKVGVWKNGAFTTALNKQQWQKEVKTCQDWRQKRMKESLQQLKKKYQQQKNSSILRSSKQQKGFNGYNTNQVNQPLKKVQIQVKDESNSQIIKPQSVQGGSQIYSKNIMNSNGI